MKPLFTFKSLLFIAIFSVAAVTATFGQTYRIANEKTSPPGFLETIDRPVYCSNSSKTWCFNVKHDYTLQTVPPDQIPFPHQVNFTSNLTELAYLIGLFQTAGNTNITGETTRQEAVWHYTNGLASTSPFIALADDMAANNSTTQGTTTVSSVLNYCNNATITIQTDERYLILANSFTEYGRIVPGSFNPASAVTASVKQGWYKINTTEPFTYEYLLEPNSVFAPYEIKAFRPMQSSNLQFWKDEEVSDPDFANCQLLMSLDQNEGIDIVVGTVSGACPQCTYTTTTSTVCIDNFTNSVYTTTGLNDPSITNYTIKADNDATIYTINPPESTFTYTKLNTGTFATNIGFSINGLNSSGQAVCESNPRFPLPLKIACVSPAPGSDLSLVKTVNNSNPTAGQTVIFSIELNNAGPDPATDVVLKDVLPSGLTYVSVSAGTYVPSTGLWTIGDVPLGTMTLTMTCTVN